MSQADEDQFFAVLEGRAESDAETSGARLLRQSVELRAETLQQIAEMDDTAVAGAQQGDAVAKRRQALFAQLQSLHAFADLPVAAAARQNAKALRAERASTPSLPGRCVAFFSGSWLRPLSFAAVLALVVGIIVQQAGYDQQTHEREVVRGASENVVVTEQAPQFVAELTTRLEASGVAVVVAQINAREWNLDVEVAATADRALIQELLRDAGFRGIEVGSTNKLVVRAAASSPTAK